MEKRRRVVLFLSGTLVLVVGAVVYLLDRGADNVYFLPGSLATGGDRPGVFGALGLWLPSFLHTFAFILMGAAVLAPLLRRPWLPCLVWSAVEVLLEIGQHDPMARGLALLVPDFFESLPVLEATKSYFLLGAFDYGDLVAIALGATAAYVTILCMCHGRVGALGARGEARPEAIGGVSCPEKRAAIAEARDYGHGRAAAILTLSLFALGLLTVVATSKGDGGATGYWGKWLWVAGSETGGETGLYGTKGTPDPLNVPGARYGAAVWFDANDDLWLFGGLAGDGPGDVLRNDLWRHDGTDWTWISGSSIPEEWGVYGAMGVPDPGNVPGARRDFSYWEDDNDNFWVFGGSGFDDSGSLGYLNDLWRYDGLDWTWMAGSSTANSPGSYGTKGVGIPSNEPPGRARSASWVDRSGRFWVFGGEPGTGLLNDLWRYDGVNWMWMSGSSAVDEPGVHGTLGTPDPGNVPGARTGAVSWVDDFSSLWLLGGDGFDEVGTRGPLCDLWQYDGVVWTWISGRPEAGVAGAYRGRGFPHSDNLPGSRYGAASWIDAAGRLWLFGGFGLDDRGIQGHLSDLWVFDGTAWAWASGSSVVSALGVYGTRGQASAADAPGARVFASSTKDINGDFWLIGGLGYDSTSGPVSLNDAWRYDP